MEGDDKKSALKRLEERLYKKNNVEESREGRHNIHRRDVSSTREWEEAKEPLFQKPQNKMSFATKIFISALVFFVITLGASLLVFFYGAKVVSTKNSDITVTGPVAIEAGEEFSFETLVENR